MKNKGITLIALVVTIIILLILAGVTIGMSTSGTGLFDKAKEAAKTYNNKAIQESMMLADYENYIDGQISGIRDNVTITSEEYNKLQAKGTWELLAQTTTSNDSINLPSGKKISDYSTLVLQDTHDDDGAINMSTSCGIEQFKTTDILMNVYNVTSFGRAHYQSDTSVVLSSDSGRKVLLYGIK